MIEYRPTTRSLSLPHGDLPLRDIPDALVRRLIEADGSCVPYHELFRVAWPHYWRDVTDETHARHNIASHLHGVQSAARDLGAVALFANVHNSGYTWAPS